MKWLHLRVSRASHHGCQGCGTFALARGKNLLDLFWPNKWPHRILHRDILARDD